MAGLLTVDAASEHMLITGKALRAHAWWAVRLVGLDEWLGRDACLTQPDACIYNLRGLPPTVLFGQDRDRSRPFREELPPDCESLPFGKAIVNCPGGTVIPLWKNSRGACDEIAACDEFYGDHGEPVAEEARVFNETPLKNFHPMFRRLRHGEFVTAAFQTGYEDDNA